MSRETIEMPRVCPLCSAPFTMWDMTHGHLCRFSLGHSLPRTPSRGRLAWAAVGTWLLAIGAVFLLAILEGL